MDRQSRSWAALIKIVAGAPRRPIKKSPTSLSGAKEGQSARGLSFRAARTTRESRHGSGSTQRVESDSEADAEFHPLNGKPRRVRSIQSVLEKAREDHELQSE